MMIKREKYMRILLLMCAMILFSSISFGQVIVSSEITGNNLQADGRRVITEIHTDSEGGRHRYSYMANIGVDIDAVMTTRVARVESAIKGREIEDFISNGADPNYTVKFVTVGVLLTKTLKYFLQNKSIEAFSIIPLIDSLTDTQINNRVPGKATKIRNRIVRLKAIQADIATDDLDIEEEV